MITVTNLKYLQLKDTLPHKNMQSFLYLFLFLLSKKSPQKRANIHVVGKGMVLTFDEVQTCINKRYFKR
ncbi:hypothetical protein UR07_11895 [Pasteurella multocida subsp. multocida]|nr:hypothetical protein UR07_11895 [Pasteurella multocida subsp. multocida]PNW25880.1 hypothetical protein AP056_00420 [Pasteurella multocida subsp. multocida]